MEEITNPVDTFRNEAEELLADIETAVLDIENHPDDKASIDRLFRSMHTIKGSGAMFGFNEIAEFTHHVETVLDKVRDGVLPVTGELINLILASRDWIKSRFDQADSEDKAQTEIKQNLISALNNLLQPSAGAPSGLTIKPGQSVKKSGSQDEMTYRIRFQPDAGMIRKGQDPFIILDSLCAMGDIHINAITDEIPMLFSYSPEDIYLYWDIFLTTRSDLNEIKDVFIFVEDHSRITITQLQDMISDASDETTPRIGEILLQRGDITPELIDQTIGQQQRLGELLINSGVISSDKIKSALTEQQVIEKRKSMESAKSIRVASEKLDTLINLVGELVITQARLSQLSEEMSEIRLTDTTEQIERLTDRLRLCALNMRMLPIGAIFGKFRRLVRDLAADLNKEAELITEGAETELDKTVIERLNDPLVHLIRNSVDHGIEPPQVRIQQGKPKQGKIILKAEHKGADVVVTIEDDGAGIDPAKIRNKAIEKGFLAANELLSDDKLLSLIFAPGFTTSEKVTDVSGRGVGMDVVKREIDALGGTIQISGKAGKNLTIHLTLPLTLAIIDGLLVNIGANKFVLPLSHLDECVELKQHLQSRHGRRLISIRGDLIPFIKLREMFDIQESSPPIEHIVIVNLDNTRIGIVVDEIVGHIQAVIKSLDKNFRHAEGISGATIMGDGSVALIADIPGIIRWAKEEEGHLAKRIKPNL